jgi:hypothetical protein
MPPCFVHARHAPRNPAPCATRTLRCRAPPGSQDSGVEVNRRRGRAQEPTGSLSGALGAHDPIRAAGWQEPIPLETIGSQPSVQRSECIGEHERLDQDARAEDQHVLVLPQAEVTDAADEQIANSKVEKAP